MFRFPRHERLKSQKRISQLFSSRQSVGAFPLRIFWIGIPQTEAQTTIQIGFSVPKKKFKRAVHRNRIKRMMREAWRLQKAELIENLNQQQLSVVGMLVFVGTEICDFREMQKAMSKTIFKLRKEFENLKI